MKKTILLCLILITYTLSSQAQITIDQSITPQFGDAWTVKYYNDVGFSEGPSGANQTWDFSTLELDGALDINFEILDPSEVLGTENFPTATFVWHIPAFEIYEFYESTPDSISLVGGLNISNGEIDFMTVYTDPEDAIRLPMTYNDSYDYFSQYNQFLFGNLLNTENRNGQFEVDAYGTLITPVGTYEDVLRVKIVETSFGIQSTQFAWLDAQNFVPLMVYEFSTDTYSPPTLYFSTPNVVNSTSEPNEANSLIKLHVDPLNNQIQIHNSAPTSSLKGGILRFISPDGRILWSRALPDIITGTNSFEFSPNFSYCGIGIANLMVEGQVISKKVWLCPNK